MKIHRTCGTLPMWCFCKIAETGDYRYLYVKDLKEGFQTYENLTGPVTNELSDAWEEILQEYSTLNKDFKVEDVFHKTLMISRLQAEYHTIMAELTYLSVDYESEFGKECVEDLRGRGYKVDISSRVNVNVSIEMIRKQAGSILTRIRLIDLEISKMKNKEVETRNASFDDLLVWVHSELGIMPDEKITVRRYISYKEQINKKISIKNRGRS